MSKANKDQTQQEFAYTFAIKKALHELAYVSQHIDTAKGVGLQGLSDGAVRQAAVAVADLRAALYNALKTV